MANFPIQQPRYPDASTMVINWAGAADKIMRGLTTGIELGLKIRDSNQDALLNAARIQQINESVAASQVSTALAQKASASMLALQEMERQKAAAEVAQITDQQNLAAQKAQWRAQQAQAQNVVESNAIVGMMTDKLRDPDVIRARRIVQSLPSLSADPVALIQKTEELQQLWDDEGSGVSAYDELQKEFQARNPTARLSPELQVPDMNQVYAMLDDPKSGYRIKTGMMLKKTITTSDEAGGTKLTTVDEPETLSVSEYVRRLQSDPAVVKRAIEDSRPVNRKANIEWIKKNVAAGTLKTVGVRDVFPGTDQEWQATLAPVAPAAPESVGITSGKTSKVSYNGKEYEVNRPIQETAFPAIRTDTEWTRIYTASPIGQAKLKYGPTAVIPPGPLSDLADASGITGAYERLTPEFSSFQTPDFKAKNLDWFETKLAKVDEEYKSTPTAEREALKTKIKSYIVSLKRDYGMQSADAGAKGVAEGVTNTPQPTLADIEQKIAAVKQKLSRQDLTEQQRQQGAVSLEKLEQQRAAIAGR